MEKIQIQDKHPGSATLITKYTEKKFSYPVGPEQQTPCLNEAHDKAEYGGREVDQPGLYGKQAQARHIAAQEAGPTQDSPQR
jgi:hypothetical protein